MVERYWLKRVADFLTFLRLLLALTVPAISAIYGRGAIADLAGWLFLVAWLTDTFDGQLARKSGLAGSGVWARLDPWVDLFAALGGLAALCTVGMVNPWVLGIVLVAVAIGCMVDFLITEGLAVFFLVATYLVFAARESIVYLVVCLTLLVAGLIAFWPRFVFLWQRFFSHVFFGYIRKRS